MTGELPGLSQRLKGERKGEDYVLSRYGSGLARVRLKVLSMVSRGTLSAVAMRVAATCTSSRPSDRLATPTASSLGCSASSTTRR